MEINKMSLREKIGQMLMIGFDGYELNTNIVRAIKEYNIGNIILFTRNFKNIEQLYGLNKELQNLSISENGHPLFIAIDQEGGMVTRITKGATFFPGNMALSAGGDEKDAYLCGKYSGEELMALGINFNLAPVLDVNNNRNNPVIGVRSYGEDPCRVAKLGRAYIKGIQESGVIATGKHFPGHGDTSIDSHIDLSSVNYDLGRLEQIELYPFRKAIEGGIKAITTAHILFPSYEKARLPATLSYQVITKLLRNNLGFKGLILTDCMEMKAIDDFFGTEKAAYMALNAGADLVCISHTFEKQIGAFNIILDKVCKGEIGEERINDSVKRILEFKQKVQVNRFMKSSIQDAKKIIDQDAHKKFARTLSEKSITLLNGKDFLPLNPQDNNLVVGPKAEVLVGIDDEIKNIDIVDAFKKQYPNYDTNIMDLKPNDNFIKNITNKSKVKDKIIVCTYNACFNKEQVELIKSIYEVNKNILAIVMRNPYDIDEFKFVKGAILVYEYTPNSIKSLIKIVTGEIKCKGKCPVTIEY
ncbi:beta-N-acetylhexosaminidase [Clostridium rectalis]|uniref:beta-N-acetylhexosaminidase n=1 Tax=Clostridium rectalis TaxID=2040295 RepID=UPI000F63DEB9|nr:beta-N-acetylhexosaminidase [Clostridium rectalis]